MAQLRAHFMRCSQDKIVLWILVEGFDAERTTKRNHPRTRFDVAHAATLIDGLAADDAVVVPIFDVSIFKFTHDVIRDCWFAGLFV